MLDICLKIWYTIGMKAKYIKVPEYAKYVGLKPRTINTHFHQGKIKGFQDPDTKTIYIENPEYSEVAIDEPKAILYARVSSHDNKKSLDGQIERMRDYAAAKGYTIVDEIQEIASGLNDKRPKFTKLLKRDDYNILIGEHKDRVTRFGFNYISTCFESMNKRIELINQTETKDDEIFDDFISIITSFCNRIYGRRRKDKTKQIIDELKK